MINFSTIKYTNAAFNVKNRQGNKNNQVFLPHDNQIAEKRNLPSLNKNNILYFTPNVISFGSNPIQKYNLKNKTILITGGTGSIAKVIIESLLKDHNPKKIIILSRDEAKQHQMRLNGFTDPKLSYVIGDVRNEASLKRSLKDVDVVIHTAAMKHVPICEDNPEEAVKTNIDGARNLIEATLGTKVKRVLAISSDKATSPSNLYGATKLVSEKLFSDANKYTGKNGPKFACVRLGNVLGSRGSIIPVFKEQSKKGEISITDTRMTRFFMTPKQVSNLVTSSIEIMDGGEVFIPKLKGTNITNLANKVTNGCKVKEVGIRPGEKLHEAFISKSEAVDTIEIDDRFIILPHNKVDKSNTLWPESKKVPQDFSYESDNKEFKMTDDELETLINDSQA